MARLQMRRQSVFEPSTAREDSALSRIHGLSNSMFESTSCYGSTLDKPSGTPQLGANILDRNTSSPVDEGEAAVVTTFILKPDSICSPSPIHLQQVQIEKEQITYKRVLHYLSVLQRLTFSQFDKEVILERAFAVAHVHDVNLPGGLLQCFSQCRANFGCGGGGGDDGDGRSVRK